MVKEILIEDIIVNPNQPRNHFDEESIKELADSIIQDGQQSPILVRPHGGKYEIVQGERRYRAHIVGRLATIRAEVKELSDDDAFHLSVIENIQREQLTAIEEARAFQRYVQMGYKHEQISQKVSKSRTYVSTRLRLLKLIPEIQDWIANRKISEGHAKQILKIEGLTDRLCGDQFYMGGIRLPFEYFQKGFVASFKDESKLTVAAVEKWAGTVHMNLIYPIIKVLLGLGDSISWQGEKVSTKSRGVCEIFDLQVDKLTSTDLEFLRDFYLSISEQLGVKKWEIHKMYEDLMERLFSSTSVLEWPAHEEFLRNQYSIKNEDGRFDNELCGRWLDSMYVFHEEDENVSCDTIEKGQ